MNYEERRQYFAYLNFFRRFQPLTREELQELLAQVKTNQNAVVTIALSCMPIVCNIIERYYQENCFANGINPMELLHIGFIQICKVIEEYDPSRNFSFRYLRNYLRGEIRNEYYKIAQLIRHTPNRRDDQNNSDDTLTIVSFDDIVYDNGEDEPIRLKDAFADKAEIQKQKMLEIVQDILDVIESNFSSFEKELIEMRYGLNSYANDGFLSLDELSRKIRIPRKKLGRIERQIFAKVKNVLQNSNNAGGKNASVYKIHANYNSKKNNKN
ncbi:MAG: sigma-70 family RNA polymerase sigma factor [Elusimicrobiota bacterium]